MPKYKRKKSGKKPSYNKKISASQPAYGTSGDHDNDVSWYTKYPKLVEAQSSIIFNSRYGSNLSVINKNNIGPGIDPDNFDNSIPGITLFNFRFTLAETGVDDDAVNMCAKNLYTYIRHANSGAANYESSDLMQYVLSVLGVSVMLEQAKRDLRLVMTYHPLNRYVFRPVLLGRGYTAAAIQDMIDNNAAYVGRINALVAQLNTFKIPRDFSLFDKFTWMVTNIFKDDGLDKASYYAYQTRDQVHYDWANRNVTFTETVNTTFPTYLQAIQSEISNLLAYEDIGIMIGDILKAYKQENCRVWSPMSLGEIQDASYSEEVLMQLNNTTAYPFTDVMNVKQINSNTQLLGLYQGSSTTPGEIVSNVTSALFQNVQVLSADTPFSPELICFEDQPSNASVIIATRNMIGTTLKAVQDSGVWKVKAFINQYPTHIVNNITVYYYTQGGGVQGTPIETLHFYSDQSADFVRASRTARLGYSLSHYPTIYQFIDDGSGYLNQFIYAYGKNNLVVSLDWLGRLHTGCKMSEYSLPMFKLLEAN